MKKSLQKRYANKLGKKITTRVVGLGKKTFVVKIFKNGIILRRARRGEIVLDKFDMYCLFDIIKALMKKEDVLDRLE